MGPLEKWKGVFVSPPPCRVERFLNYNPITRRAIIFTTKAFWVVGIMLKNKQCLPTKNIPLQTPTGHKGHKALSSDLGIRFTRNFFISIYKLSKENIIACISAHAHVRIQVISSLYQPMHERVYLVNLTFF